MRNTGIEYTSAERTPTILPELAVTEDNRVVKIKTENAPKLSFGMFYKSRPESEVVRKFLQITKRFFDARTEGSLNID